MDQDELLGLILTGIETVQTVSSPQDAHSTRLRMQSYLQEEVRKQPQLAHALTRLAQIRTLPPETIQLVITIVSARGDLQDVTDFVAALMMDTNTETAIAAAHAAFNLASQSAPMRDAIVAAAESINKATDQNLAATLIRNLRAVPTDDRVVAVLRGALTRTDLPTIVVAALDVLGERTLRDVSSNDTPSQALSDTSQAIQRTDSRSIRLASIDVVEKIVRELIEEQREDPWIQVAGAGLLGSLSALRTWTAAHDDGPPDAAARDVLHRLADAYTNLHPLVQKGLDYGLQVALRAMLQEFGIALP